MVDSRDGGGVMVDSQHGEEGGWLTPGMGGGVMVDSWHVGRDDG